MKIETMVKITNSKGNSDLYQMFCSAARGDYVAEISDKHAVVHLEKKVDDAFDKFAQKMFEAGMKHEREVNGK